jgi:putative transposase
MGRAPRLEFRGATYHVFARGNRRERIFLDDEDYDTYVRDLRKLAHQLDVGVLAYCLMPNHPHLCIQTHGAPLSAFMHRLNTRQARRFNNKYKLRGHLHEGRYRSILVENEPYLLRLVRYIHQNPIRAGLTKALGDWRYSSYPHYLARQTWIHRQPVLERLTTIADFQRFMAEPVSPEDAEVFRSAGRGFRAAGTPAIFEIASAAVEQSPKPRALWLPLGQARLLSEDNIELEASAWLNENQPSVSISGLQSSMLCEPFRSTRRQLVSYLRSRHYSLRSIGLLLARDTSSISRLAASRLLAVPDLQNCSVN